ncbi:uncharacterized protein TNCV_3153951 [Trichonephila clavipes]|nr:uncharacterized protein TNCV_3153951 [Trichonephila clavipes]
MPLVVRLIILFGSRKIEPVFNPQNDKIWCEDAPRNSALVEHRQYPKLVMVLGGICLIGKTPLVFVEEGIKIKVYQRDIIEAVVLPWDQKHFVNANWMHKPLKSLVEAKSKRRKSGTKRIFQTYHPKNDLLLASSQSHGLQSNYAIFLGNVSPDTVNGMKLQRDLVTLNTDQEIETSLVFNGNIVMENDLWVQGLINGVNVTQLAGEAVYLDTNQTIVGPYHFTAAQVTSDVAVEGLVNGVDLPVLDKNVDAFWMDITQSLQTMDRHSLDSCELANDLQHVLSKVCDADCCAIGPGFECRRRRGCLEMYAFTAWGDINSCPAVSLLLRLGNVAAVAKWYRYRIVACLVTSSSPVPLKTRRVGQRCTLNLSRAETSSRWCGVVVRRGGASSGVVHVT